MTSQLDTTIRRLRSKWGLETRTGLLTKVSGVVQDTDTGLLWVRERMSTATYAPPARLPLKPGVSLPIRENIPVLITTDETGQSVISGPNMAAAQVQGLPPQAFNALNAAARGLIHQEELGDLLCRHHPTKAGYAQVLPGVTLFGNKPVSYAGGEIDLSGSKPAAGNHRYIAVFLKSDGTLALGSSTTQADSSALDDTDLQECIDNAPANSKPLRAFVWDGDNSDFDDNLEATTTYPYPAKDLRNLADMFDVDVLTADSAPDRAADYVPIWDESGNTHKKTLINTLYQAALAIAVCFQEEVICFNEEIVYL